MPPIEPNPRIAAMDAYALPDISAADGEEAIVLAQNEHAWPPSARVRAAISEVIGQVQLYPDSEWSDLRAAIAEVHRLDYDRILCGAGSMELMACLIQAYLSQHDRILMSDYGYLYMRTLARLVGAAVDSAPEPDFRVDVDAMLERLSPATRLVFVVNPGNPCGSVIHNDEIRRLRTALPEDVILLIDEAYAEFVEPGFHQPLFDLVDAGNTVITRTFSKIYGLAGMRVGWGYFPLAIREQLRKLQSPSSVTLLSQAAATAAMRDQEGAREAGRLIAEQRDYLSREVAALGLRVVPSQANFILIDFTSSPRAAQAFQFLRQRRLVLRPMAGYGLPACLRATVGTAAQMQLLVAALSEWNRHDTDG